MSIGGMAFGAPGDDESRLQVLDRLYELGETMWDTARIYVRCEMVYKVKLLPTNIKWPNVLF